MAKRGDTGARWYRATMPLELFREPSSPRRGLDNQQAKIRRSEEESLYLKQIGEFTNYLYQGLAALENRRLKAEENRGLRFKPLEDSRILARLKPYDRRIGLVLTYTEAGINHEITLNGQSMVIDGPVLMDLLGVAARDVAEKRGYKQPIKTGIIIDLSCRKN